MILARKNKNAANVVGVDLDTDSVAAAELGPGGQLRSGVRRLPDGAFAGGEIVDGGIVSDSLRDLFATQKLSKHVRLAVASQGVAFRTLRLPLIEDPDQLRSAVRFQAQEQIPMPLDSAVLDHQVIGAEVSEDGGRKIDVAVVAARRESVEGILKTARGAGLDPVGIDLAAFGMIRALANPVVASDAEAAAPGSSEYATATLYCSLGGITNLAIARGFACLFSRVAQFSVRGIAEELATSTGLTTEHAEQWLVHTGLESSIEEVPGDPNTVAATRAALEGSVDRLADELRLSLDYYGAQEGVPPVEDVVLCGWGSAIPGLTASLGASLGREVSVRRPQALASVSDGEAARLTLPYGLALER